MMFSCAQMWEAIERLAAAKGISTSRLAILAGLDPTALNPSKRAKPDGTLRWPSTETLSKILSATDTSMRDFAALLDAISRPGQATPRTILIVEDDETLGGVATEILRSAGYRVHYAQSHDRALKLLEGNEPIDLLFTDLVNPAGLGGIALARIALRCRPGIKVIYTTAYDIPGLIDTGTDVVLHKPVDAKRLLSVIGDAI
jgi:CheY-like chemotaxis protein